MGGGCFQGTAASIVQRALHASPATLRACQHVPTPQASAATAAPPPPAAV
jgi:hypothetical protein